MTPEIRAAIVTARDALQAAVAAVQTARDLWDAAAPSSPAMNGAFPLSDWCPLSPPAAQAYFAEVNKSLRG